MNNFFIIIITIYHHLYIFSYICGYVLQIDGYTFVCLRDQVHYIDVMYDIPSYITICIGTYNFNMTL